MIIQPNWPVPAYVKAAITTRQGGVSHGCYQSFNLAGHVGDQPQQVEQNRQLLRQQLQLPNPPQWLNQVHGTTLVKAHADGQVRTADACFTEQAGVVCAVLTADCLPLLLFDRQQNKKNKIAAVHAGWRGLAADILANTLAQGGFSPEHTLVWLGPAIGPQHYQVDNPVRQCFIQQNHLLAAAFQAQPDKPGHWLADLYQIATIQLNQLGVRQIYGGGYCTYSDPRFYSYRREGMTGRMASLIWLNAK
jgi:YfiH family protein